MAWGRERAEWRCTITECGGPCVMTTLAWTMPTLCASSWGTPTPSRSLVTLLLVLELDRWATQLKHTIHACISGRTLITLHPHPLHTSHTSTPHTHITHTQIWLSGVECVGTETSLYDCPHDPWGEVGSCSHVSDAGVICTNVPVNPFPVRLADGEP